MSQECVDNICKIKILKMVECLVRNCKKFYIDDFET